MFIPVKNKFTVTEYPPISRYPKYFSEYPKYSKEEFFNEKLEV